VARWLSQGSGNSGGYASSSTARSAKLPDLAAAALSSSAGAADAAASDAAAASKVAFAECLAHLHRLLTGVAPPAPSTIRCCVQVILGTGAGVSVRQQLAAQAGKQTQAKARLPAPRTPPLASEQPPKKRLRTPPKAIAPGPQPPTASAPVPCKAELPAKQMPVSQREQREQPSMPASRSKIAHTTSKAILQSLEAQHRKMPRRQSIFGCSL
jgi:hypothetical protein